MNYESFKYTSEEGVGHLILDKGEDLNKMTMNFWYELPRILDEIDKDASLRVLILSSTGKHFCAGMDLKNFGKGEDLNKMTMNFWYELPRILDEIDKDASLRVLILSSTGKHFCAGMDLKNFGSLIKMLRLEF